MILSVARLLRHSLGLEAEAAALEQAVPLAIERGARAPDIAVDRHNACSTEQVGYAVLSATQSDPFSSHR